jgi:cell division protein ZipA
MTAVDEFSSTLPDVSSHGQPLEPEISETAEIPVASKVVAPPAEEDDEESPEEPETADAETEESGVHESLAPPDSDVEPIVDWPDENVRKIVALRLVSAPGERFSGRAVRMALAAEGFRLGQFEIFHKPGPDARAVLSAASLTKPGTFSLQTMDAQRFGGLSLFAVLPGPLSPAATFDELLVTARSLNDRLRGALQDERGEPLTPVRSASLRDGLVASANANAAATASPITTTTGAANAPVAGPPA